MNTNTDYHTKPSKFGQFNERSDSPMRAGQMTPQQIEEFRGVLAKSYQCNISEITYNFARITDENDEDRHDCMLLEYLITVEDDGKPSLRSIFSRKIPIPEHIRQRADELKRRGNTVQNPPRPKVQRPFTAKK